MIALTYVAAIQYYDIRDEVPSLKVAYVGTKGFTTKPSDTPANTHVLECVETPALVRRDCFDVGTTGGASRVGYGELVLRNDDGALDWLNDVALDGRLLTVRYAQGVPAYPSGFAMLFKGTMEQVEVGTDSVKIRTRDRQVFATSAFQPHQYGGTNVLPEGVDGIETDLKGKAKPVVLGAVRNATPYCVNTSKLIYQIHDGSGFDALRDVTAVYDAGALLTPGADYADQAAMEATEPEAGTYRKWKAGGCFRLGSSSFGEVTCDAVQGETFYERTAGQLFRVVLESAGIDSADISSADIEALDAANSATLGLYVKEETTNQQVLDDITRSVGAWWASDADGVLRVQRLEAPSGDAVASFTDSQIVKGSLKRIPLNDGGLPVWRVTVRGVPNYTVQKNGLAGIVGAARRARLEQPYQDAVAEDTDVKTAHPLAPDLIVETKLQCLDACQTEADRLLALYGVKRDRFELEVEATATVLAALELGAVIRLTHPRFSLSAGRDFRVLGFQLNPAMGRASLTVWG